MSGTTDQVRVPAGEPPPPGRSPHDRSVKSVLRDLPRWWWRPAAGLLVAAAVILVGSAAPFRAIQWTSWALYGLLALSLTLVWGHGGIFSFGQAAFFGVGAYVYGIVGINLVGTTNETVSALLGGTVAAALIAGLLGYFMFYGHVGDVYVAIITLATTLVLLTVMGSTAGPQYRVGDALLGGYNGMTGIPPLTLGWPGGPEHILSATQALAATVVAAAIIALGARRMLERPFGRITAAVRENELRTQLLGYDIRRQKLAVFALGGAIAGLAGAGFAAWGQFINPSVFSLQQAALVVIWVLVGGRTSLGGAFIGVAVVQALSSALGQGGGSYTPIVLGGILIGIVLVLPTGLVPTVTRWAQRYIPRLRPRPPALPEPVDSARLLATGGNGRRTRPGALRAVNVTKHFGGVKAVEDVSITFPEKGVHCLIGPNGAGKSTFFNVLMGRYEPTDGHVIFADEDVTSSKLHERAQSGLGIKVQVPSIYGELTVFENLWIAAYARRRRPEEAARHATGLLDWLGLRERAHSRAGVLSHGEQQWLEIGLVLAADPSVIMLDEPTAGMTREETNRTVEIVRGLAADRSVIVVEHDMNFVRRLDALTTVLHQGRVFAQGPLEEIRADERVLDIYLGRRG